MLSRPCFFLSKCHKLQLHRIL